MTNFFCTLCQKKMIDSLDVFLVTLKKKSKADKIESLDSKDFEITIVSEIICVECLEKCFPGWFELYKKGVTCPGCGYIHSYDEVKITKEEE